ncbi:hypothetical protein C8R44DRAFT_975117 [Mycena epipterygia]|nr:hypothetical protein C8R44DRAFT_975117 [Mycena epipterygia]
MKLLLNWIPAILALLYLPTALGFSIQCIKDESGSCLQGTIANRAPGGVGAGGEFHI